MKQKIGLRQLTVMAMLCALAYASLFAVRIPVGGFLTYDAKDALLAIGGLLYGPVAAVLMALVVAAAECVTVSTTGAIGLLMNFLSTALFIVPAAVLYPRRRTLRSALCGLGIGVAAMTAGMLLWNWLITPIYTGMPRGEVLKLILPLLLPFNLLKAGINATITVLLYKTAVTALRRAHLLPPVEENRRGTARASIILGAAFVLASLVLILLIWRGKL